MVMVARTATNMVTRRMTTDILTLTQLLSPNFPVGAFAYSHGLETAIHDGAIYDAASLQDWLHDLLHFGSAQSDAVLVNMTYAGDTSEVDSIARAFAASVERLKETDLKEPRFATQCERSGTLSLGACAIPWQWVKWYARWALIQSFVQLCTCRLSSPTLLPPRCAWSRWGS